MNALLADQPADSDQNPFLLKRSLGNRFEVGYVSTIKIEGEVGNINTIGYDCYQMLGNMTFDTFVLQRVTDACDLIQSSQRPRHQLLIKSIIEYNIPAMNRSNNRYATYLF